MSQCTPCCCCCALLAGLGSRFGFGHKGASSNKKDDDADIDAVAAPAGVGNISDRVETELSAMPGVTTRRRPAVARA